MKTYFFTFCVLFSLGLGISFYFKEEIGKNIYKVGAAQIVSADNLMEDEKKGNPAARNPSSLATKHRVIEEKNSFYKNNLYWNKMKQDPSVERLYLKSLNISLTSSSVDITNLNW